MRKVFWNFMLWLSLLGFASAEVNLEYLKSSYDGCKKGLQDQKEALKLPIEIIADDAGQKFRLVYKDRFDTEVKIYFFNAQYKIKARYYDVNYTGLERIETIDLNPNTDPELTKAESLQNEANSHCQTVLDKLEKYPFEQPHGSILTTLDFKSQFLAKLEESNIGLTVEEPKEQLIEQEDVAELNTKQNFELKDKAVRSAIVFLRNANNDHVATVVFSKSEFMLIEVFIQVHGVTIRRVLSTDTVDNRYENYLLEIVESIKSGVKEQEIISKSQLSTVVFEAFELFACEVPQDQITLNKGVLLLHFSNTATVVQVAGLAEKVQQKAQKIIADKLAAIQAAKEAELSNSGTGEELDPNAGSNLTGEEELNSPQNDLQDEQEQGVDQTDLEAPIEGGGIKNPGEEETGNSLDSDRRLSQPSSQNQLLEILSSGAQPTLKGVKTVNKSVNDIFAHEKAILGDPKLTTSSIAIFSENKISAENRKLFNEPFIFETPDCPFKKIKFGLNQFSHVSFPFIQVRMESIEQGLEPVVLEYFLHSPDKEIFAIKLHELLLQLNNKLWLLRDSAKNGVKDKNDGSEIAISDFEAAIKAAVDEQAGKIKLTWEVKDDSANAIFNDQLAIQITKKLGIEKEPAKWSIWFFKFPDLNVYKHLHYELSISAKRNDAQFPLFAADLQNFVKTFGTAQTDQKLRLN